MSSLDGQHVLVTGAGGFIGSHLVEALVASGARVRALCRYTSRNERGALDALDPEIAKSVEVTLGDVRDVESVAEAVSGVSAVFHLAAQIAVPYSFRNPRDFVETNVGGTLNVALAARDAGVERVVHMSTSEVYGSAVRTPMDEDHPLRPRSPYAASKLGAESLMMSFHHSYELPATVVRAFNTYGPRQSARALVPTVIGQTLGADVIRLGALDPTRDLLYVQDTAAGLIAAAGEPAGIGRIIGLGTGREHSVAEVVRIVGEAAGRTPPVAEDPQRIRPATSEVDRLVCDPSLARELLGWSSSVSLPEGVARTVAWTERTAPDHRINEYVT